MTLRTLVTAVTVLLLAGCAPFDRASPPEPDFYRLSYEAGFAQCGASFTEGVAIRDFTADRPFEQRRMVLLGENKTVRFSEKARWVAEPGTMLSEALRRDLSRGELFPGVAEESDVEGSSLELTGRIVRFAAEPCGSDYRALLGVTVRLEQRSGGQRLWRKDYSLQSDCFPAGEADRFARAMSRLVSEFSSGVRSDLCRMAREGGR